jgi:isopenicillin N synthase-like dioxygenase
VSKLRTGQHASNQLPVIDVAPLFQATECPQTAAALYRTATTSGFVYIRNHGIPDSVIQNARASALGFFAQPENVKSELTVSKHHHGWLPSGGAQMADDITTDRKESFIWGEENRLQPGPEEHVLRGPNQWPDQSIPDLRQHALQWFDCTQDLAQHLLRAFAFALGINTNFFVRHNNRPLSRASFVYYPPHASVGGVDLPPPNQFGVGPHTDFGVLTILCQDHVGGLEIENEQGNWHPAPPIADTLVVNVGDLLARWTNGVYKSARHRVTIPYKSERLSLVLAYDPNAETLIDARNIYPASTDCPAPIRCGDYLDWRFARAFAYRR